MDTCKDELSQKDILHFLIQLWHAVRDEENRSIVKWVKSGRVFRIVNVRRFFSEICPDICDDWTPAYFEHFMICCGFDAIPPRFVDYFHNDFLQNDYSRIERIRAKCALLAPKAYNQNLEEQPEFFRFDLNDKTFAQLVESRDKSCHNEEDWPEPEDFPESPLTPEAADLSGDSNFILDKFPSDMLSELDSMKFSTQDFSLELTSYSKSSEVKETKPQAAQSAISLNDLKSSLKLSLVHCLSTDSTSTDVSSSPTYISFLPSNFHQKGFETNADSSSSKFPIEIDSDFSSPSPPESFCSPNVSPLGISKRRDSLVFDPSDPFNLFNQSAPDHSWTSPLTQSISSCATFLDSQILPNPLDPQICQNSVPMNEQLPKSVSLDSLTLLNSAPSDPQTRQDSAPLNQQLPNSVPLNSLTFSNSVPSDKPTSENSESFDTQTSTKRVPLDPLTHRSLPINVPTFPITIL